MRSNLPFSFALGPLLQAAALGLALCANPGAGADLVGRNAVEPAGVVPNAGGQGFRIGPADFGHLEQGRAHESRFVAPVAVALRCRGQVGGVCLYQQAVFRDAGG